MVYCVMMSLEGRRRRKWDANGEKSIFGAKLEVWYTHKRHGSILATD